MILCGTDLFSASLPVLRAAAALAHKRNEALLLVAVIESPEPNASLSADAKLEQHAAELRRSFGVTVEVCVAYGAPEQQLLQIAKARAASLIVLGGEPAARHGRRLGSVPEYLCQAAEAPVLIVRNPEPLVQWSEATRMLRVLLGSGFGNASRSALAQIASWPDTALTVAHVAWPYAEHYRLGIPSPIPPDHLRPDVQQQLLGDLRHWVSETACSNEPTLNVTAGWGRIDSHLAQLAHAQNVDLLVVGTHQRSLANRRWHGSVSRNALHEASCNVLCVPESARAAHAGKAPRTIVVPTDFSSLADRAVAYAYSLLEHGGSIHLVHVVDHSRKSEHPVLKERLTGRIPTDAHLHKIVTETLVLEGDTPWLAIWQHAGRVRADLICMATHSHSAATSLVLGSQARALLQRSRLPVLLVPPDREN